MKKSFFINGGAGRVLCAVPALEEYKKNIDPDVIIVAEGWSELFLSTSLRNNVWPLGSKDLFNKIKNTEIITPEPYRLNAYFNQQVNLIQAFDILINNVDPTTPSKPLKLDIGKDDQIYGHNLVSQIKHQLQKTKAIVLQPFGSTVRAEGNFIWDASGRSFEVKDLFTLVDLLTKDYAVILMTNVQIPTEKQMNAAIPNDASLLQWMGIINAADYFLGCDSVGQHIAHALNKPATVVIGSTYPENISYPQNKNFTIIDNGIDKRQYSPLRLTPCIEVDRDNEDLMILSDSTVNKIIKSIKNKIGTGSVTKIESPKTNYLPPMDSKFSKMLQGKK